MIRKDNARKIFKTEYIWLEKILYQPAFLSTMSKKTDA